MARVIELTRGFCTVVDDDDYEWLSTSNWSALVQGEHVYAVKNDGACGHTRMHREILKRHGMPVVDHVNRQTLDNRKKNLRPCEKGHNNVNRRKSFGKSSKYKGVSFWKTRGVWSAYITHNGKRVSLGNFKAEDDAARAYDTAAQRLFGEFAHLNFQRSQEAESD